MESSAFIDKTHFHPICMLEILLDWFLSSKLWNAGLNSVDFFHNIYSCQKIISKVSVKFFFQLCKTQSVGLI